MAILLKLTLTTICVCVFQPYDCVGVFNWIWGSDDEYAVTRSSPENEYANADVSSLLAKIPFELQASDEKFLSEAMKLTDMTSSHLDSCHHKAILELKKSCAQLTEEEIGKLSVNLLNCQSAVEGRPIYPCTKTMTIRECTSKMDRDTWNAYHIISNRARAVCYGSRQVQFKAKTEMAVNKLVSTSEQQLVAMNMLQEGQEKLSKVTDDTLESISVGHRNLMLQQEMLKNTQDSIRTYVSSNLRQLTVEKALIAAGQKELSLMTESIKQKLDKASEQLTSQEDDRKKSHNEILSDLSELQQKAKSVWEKIENSTAKILDQHVASMEHYHTALDNLQRVNQSISYLLVLVEKTRSEIDAKLEWLTHVAGGTGNQLAIVVSVVSHVGYFLLGAVTMSFINAPLITRVALVVAVPLNLLNEIKNGLSLDFLMLTVIVMLSTLLHWLSGVIKRTLTKRSSPGVSSNLDPLKLTGPGPTANAFPHFPSNNPRQAPNSNNFSDESMDEDEEEDVVAPTFSNILNESNLSLRSNSAFRNYRPTSNGGVNNSTMQLSDASPDDHKTILSTTLNVLEQPDGIFDSSPRRLTRRSVSRSSTPVRNGSPVPKIMCQAQNKAGLRCRKGVVAGKDYCYVHLEPNS